MAAPNTSSSTTQNNAAKGTSLTYDGILAAPIQPIDIDSKSTPIGTRGSARVSDFLSPMGGVVYLVRRPGCALCRADVKEFAEVFERYFPIADAASDPDLKSRPHFLALVKENIDDELRAFLPSLTPGGTLYLHSDRSLYKQLNVAKMGVFDLMSWSMLKKHSADQKLHGGNMKGEGFVKGAIVVMGSPSQGILHVHLEEFGKKLDTTQIEQAISQIEGAKLPEPGEVRQPTEKKPVECKL